MQWTGTLHPDIAFEPLRSLCSLEFNIHQLILSDLAASVGASKDDPADPTIDSSIDLIASNVTTRAIFTDDEDGSSVNVSLEQRVFMVGAPPIL
jgi:phosphatidylinositol 4-kinase